MGKTRKPKPAERHKKLTMNDREQDQMFRTALAFSGAATYLRNLDAGTDTPGGYGVFNALCVNIGYGIELFLKVLSNIHNRDFIKTHELEALHNSLPESVRDLLHRGFYHYAAEFGIKVSYIDGLALEDFDNEPILLPAIPYSFAACMEEFDRIGMTARRYSDFSNDDIMLPNHVQQALICAGVLDTAVRHFVNKP